MTDVSSDHVSNDDKSSSDGCIRHVSIENTQHKHANGVYNTICLGYGVSPEEAHEDCTPKAVLEQQLTRFPEGQFVAVHHDGEQEQVVGVAITMRTNTPPAKGEQTWFDLVGSLNLPKHEADGKWLYGVDMVVHPDFRRQGVGTALYKARFELVKRLNLRGWYAGGMLMGYQHYAHNMTPEAYADKVRRRELQDPTVTMQMNRGFKAVKLIKDYYPIPDAHGAAMLIVWHNKHYKLPKAQPTLRGESVQRT